MYPRLPSGRAAPPVKGRGMNSIEQGLPQVDSSACRKTLAPFRRGGLATAPQHVVAAPDSKQPITCLNEDNVSRTEIVGMRLDIARGGDVSWPLMGSSTSRLGDQEDNEPNPSICTPLSNRVVPLEETADQTTTESPVLTSLSEELPRCAASPTLSLRTTEIAIPRSRTAKRNARRSFARYRAKQQLRAQKQVMRQRHRQYEQDLALARSIQAALDSETSQYPRNKLLLPLRSMERVRSPRRRQQLQSVTQGRRRQKLQQSRIQGRNIKRHLALQAKERNWTLPRPYSTCLTFNESFSSSCIGILDWWSVDLQKQLQAELEMMHEDCLKQQAPRQPSPPVVLWGIYDYGDCSSPAALNFFSCLESDQLTNNEHVGALNTILSIANASGRSKTFDAPSSMGVYPEVDKGAVHNHSNQRFRATTPQQKVPNEAAKQQRSRIRNIFWIWAQYMGRMRILRDVLRRVLWQLKFLRLSRRAQNIIGYNAAIWDRWRRQQAKRFSQCLKKRVPTTLGVTQRSALSVVLHASGYLIVTILWGWALMSHLDSPENWLQVFCIWVHYVSTTMCHGFGHQRIDQLLRQGKGIIHNLLVPFRARRPIEMFYRSLQDCLDYPYILMTHLGRWETVSPVGLTIALFLVWAHTPAWRETCSSGALSYQMRSSKSSEVARVSTLSHSVDTSSAWSMTNCIGRQLLSLPRHFLYQHLLSLICTVIVVAAFACLRMGGLLHGPEDWANGIGCVNECLEVEDLECFGRTADRIVIDTTPGIGGVKSINIVEGTKLENGIGTHLVVDDQMTVGEGKWMGVEDAVTTCSGRDCPATKDIIVPSDDIDLRRDVANRSANDSVGDSGSQVIANDMIDVCAVHCVFFGDNGHAKVLSNISATSLCSEVYAAAGLGPGLFSNCFYLKCNGRRFSSSDVPLHHFLVCGRAELQLVGSLRGANDDEDTASNQSSNRPNSSNTALLHFPTVSIPPDSYPINDEISIPHERVAGECDHAPGVSASTTRNMSATKEVGPGVSKLRRSARSCVRNVTVTNLEEPKIMRVIYTMGNLPIKDRDSWEQLLHAFHNDTSVQSAVDDYIRTAQKHLEWATDEVGGFGVDYRVKLLIPKGTRFGYYSGAITLTVLRSNHVLTVGNFGGSTVCLFIDGCPEKNATRDAGHMGLVQMVNHSCRPNCRIVPIQTAPGLELFVLEALVDIPVGARPTFNYDACVTEKQKRNGKSFWRWYSIFAPRAAGKCQRRIRCLCAGAPGQCPNGLWRDERITQPVAIDHNTPQGFSGLDEDPSEQSILEAVVADKTSVDSQTGQPGLPSLIANPARTVESTRRSVGTKSMALLQSLVSQDIKSKIAGRIVHDLRRHSNSRVQNTNSSCHVTPRQVLLGVYVLPQFWLTPYSDRLSETLAHLMQCSRLELTKYNGKGIVPRGRTTNPVERIEVDLSFLRSIDPSDRMRLAAQRGFVCKHLDSFRTLSVALDGVMERFRLAVEQIVGAETSKWSYFAYALEALPGTPPQDEHQDRGSVPRKQYFTCIIPVTAGAEPTEFCPPRGDSEYWKFPGPVLFDGHAWHRGPAISTETRRVLSLVACKAREDKNHDSATPFRWRKDWKPETRLSTLSISEATSYVDNVNREAPATVQILGRVEECAEEGVLEAQLQPAILPPCTDTVSEEIKNIEIRVCQLQNELDGDELDVDSLESALQHCTAEEEQLDQTRRILHQVTLHSVYKTDPMKTWSAEINPVSISDLGHSVLGKAANQPLPPEQTAYVGIAPERSRPMVSPESNDSFSTTLRFELLAASLQVTAENYAVNNTPYGRLSGNFTLQWRGVTVPIVLRDEVRAARAEGSCYLLCVLDLIREAECSQDFRTRRLIHPELQGAFQERWELMLGMATDRDASGLRQAICLHLLSKPDHFRSAFPRPPNLTSRQWDELRAMGRSLKIPIDDYDVVHRSALNFLRPSEHAEEGFMMVLLDWLGHKVAILNLLQVTTEGNSPLFLHSCAVDHITDEAVLMLKVLNIEKGNQTRDCLNHFDRVSGMNPVEFLEDLRPVSEPVDLTSTAMGRGDPAQSETEPNTLATALARLHTFDISTAWGPSQSCTRMERLQRLKNLQAAPAGWEWVESIFRQFPCLAAAKPGDLVVTTRVENLLATRPADGLCLPRPDLRKQQVPGTGGTVLPSTGGPVRIGALQSLPRTPLRFAPYAPLSSNKCGMPKVITAGTTVPRPTVHRRAFPLPVTIGCLSTPNSIVNYFQSASASQSAVGLDGAGGCRVIIKSAITSTQEAVPSHVLSDTRKESTPVLDTTSDEAQRLRHRISTDVTDARPLDSAPLQMIRLESCLPIPCRRLISGLTPWKPGTTGLYPRPIGAAPPRTVSLDFPIWTVRVPGKRPQEAMFQVADGIGTATSTFYVAADTWRYDKKYGWGLSKIYGAFQDVESFIAQLLIPAPTRCFYEIVRANSPCKAYFDLEVGGGVLSPAQGVALCQKVIAEWAVRIGTRWPEAMRECPRCLDPIVLDGSRQTNNGWKVSYHLVYPFLTFPCNNTMLKEEATALSNLPQLQVLLADGTPHRFVDTAVYSRNQLFRMPLNFKLSDDTCTPLRTSGACTVSDFRAACVTCLEVDAWTIPDDGKSRDPPVRRLHKQARPTGSEALPCRSPSNEDADVAESILVLLRQAGQPDGRLQIQSGNVDKVTFRWDASPRPCLIAQIWRPRNPTHNSNGAFVTYDSSRAVFLKCLHSECQKLCRGRGVFLGYLPCTIPVQRMTEQHQKELQSRKDKRHLCSKSSDPSPSISPPVRTLLPFSKSHPSVAPLQTAPDTSSHCSEDLPETNGNLPPVTMTERNSPEVDDHNTHVCPRSLTQAQSLLRIFSQNQKQDDGPFTGWTVEVDAWGGRLGDFAESHDQRRDGLPSSHTPGQPTQSCADFDAQVQAWVSAEPFTAPAPERLVTELRASLESANQEYATTCGGALPGWTTVQAKTPSPLSTHGNQDTGIVSWTVEPPCTWYEQPLGFRVNVGADLLRSALNKLYTGISGPDHSPSLRMTTADQPSLWDSPFIVGFLSVGFRRFRCSIPGVVEFLDRYRPDILFLGDLGVKRNKIGRLKLRIEAAMSEEWFLWTDISASPGYPVGSGALIHSSAAKHISRLQLEKPPNVDDGDWRRAIDGRVFGVTLTRPGTTGPLHMIGVNQHVASSENAHLRAILLSTVACTNARLTAKGENLICIGDFNAAPEGGRWGYSCKSKTWAADRLTAEWALQHRFREVLSSPLRATWKACLQQRKAALDRAWVSPANLPVSPLVINWADSQPVFDHAMIMIRLPGEIAGLGYAGACRPLGSQAAPQVCRVNLKRLRNPELLKEWNRLVHLSLTETEDAATQAPRDPFAALKHAERVADSIAYSLAPRRTPQAGEIRRSFEFEGHRVIFREMNLLREARTLVRLILQKSPEIMSCPHRAIRWNTTMSRLDRNLRRSRLARPPVIHHDAQWYFTSAATNFLTTWMDAAKSTIDVRWATVRESFAKAHFLNAQECRAKLIRAGGMLDKHIVRNALGRRQPKQRMWGLQGTVPLGIQLMIATSAQTKLLEFLHALPQSQTVVRILGGPDDLQLWFRGPRSLGDFLHQWCSVGHAWTNLGLQILSSPQQYVAIVPDDMLAVQELHLAREGMDSESVCFNCKARDVQPIVTTSTSSSAQLCGNPQRKIRFFCHSCRTVHDKVDLAPLPPCPVPLAVWNSLRRIDPNSPPLLARHIDFATLEAYVRRLMNNKSTGCDLIPREYYKYGPTVLLEILRAALNAYLAGQEPTVGAEEWVGGIVTNIPKEQSAIAVTDYRPIVRLCTKLIIRDGICNDRIKQVTEDKQLVDDVQEGFRRHRSAKRQLSKILGILEDLRRRKAGLSVMLFLDIKNAFNAVNHRVIFLVLETYGFPAEDINLLRRMYSQSFLVVSNSFGDTAVLYLLRGFFQGAPSSPIMFILTFDPFHKMIRASGRGCFMTALNAPTGSSPFADDSTLHTDGPDAISAMSVLVRGAGDYVRWLGPLVNMRKSYISAIDFSTGQPVATDSITLNGSPFSWLSPDQAHKHLGVRMTLTGNFEAEKKHVREEMKRRLESLTSDDVLSPSLKELAIKVGVVSIFRYSAGLVPWTRRELDHISKIWSAGYKHAWYGKAGRSADATPMILSSEDGGRDCPSACEVWIRDALDLYDQCLSLPGEISRLSLYFLQQTCLAHGCWTLNQLQRILRIGGRPESASVVELLMLRLDEQGLEVSSPWEQPTDRLLADALWPQLQAVWKRKEEWAGCSELDEYLQTCWDQAKQCLVVLRKLGQTGILTVSQLIASGNWLHLSDLRQRHCVLLDRDYNTFLEWLHKAGMQSAEAVEQTRRAPARPAAQTLQHQRTCHGPIPSTAKVHLPPCIAGFMKAVAPHDQVELITPPLESGGTTPLHEISDPALITELCRLRSTFSVTLDGNTFLLVECLVPLSRIWQGPSIPDSVVVQAVNADSIAHPFAVLNPALVRDSLRANGAETLSEACIRESWLVAKADLNKWFDLSSPTLANQPARWQLTAQSGCSQQVLGGVVQCIRPRRNLRACELPSPLHPWQVDPPLSDLVSINLSNHYNQVLPSPEGWDISKRNARILISSPGSRVLGMDAAHYEMLVELHGQTPTPTESFLQAVLASGERQRIADLSYQVPWNRHLLACLRYKLGVNLLVGSRAVTFNPHFPYFSSPDVSDSVLGSVQQWPVASALLLLDSFEPSKREQIIQQAADHNNEVWILRLDRPSNSAALDMQLIRSKRATLTAVLPSKSLILHSPSCWSEAKWDAAPSEHAAQIWRLLPQNSQSTANFARTGAVGYANPPLLQHQLGDWLIRRYDFYSCVGNPTRSLQCYRTRQQDACQYSHSGLLAATDGSVNLKEDRMGASFVVVEAQKSVALLTLSAPVGGPLATLRAEAVGLLYLLRRVKEYFKRAVQMLIFVDCLALLLVLQKWGRSDFWPGPREVLHFDVIFPLIQELRQWSEQLTLVKVKSHTGCQLNEMADELADAGCASADDPICPGPQKYGSLLLRVRASLRNQIAEEKTGHLLPRDGAPNKALLKSTVAVNTLRAAKLRSTIFVREALLREDCSAACTVIAKCDDSTVRCWMKMMSAIYPVQTYLYRIKKVNSPNCIYCNDNQLESLTHFLKLCPRFHHARTAVHNKVRRALYQVLQRHISTDWDLMEETPLSQTQLHLNSVPSAIVQQAGRPVKDSDIQTGYTSLGRWQPDIFGVSFAKKKIAIGPEVTLPSDTRLTALTDAFDRKHQTYTPLITALQDYVDSGWTVRILPWVVGARGMIKRSHLTDALEFLEIPRQKWATIIDCTIRTSLEGLAYMNQIRFSISQQNNTFDTDDPKESRVTQERLLSVGRKRKIPKNGDDLQAMQLRWRRIVGARGHQPQRSTSGDQEQPSSARC